MTQDSTTSPRSRLVVGVDGSEPSKVALRWAARLAPSMDAGIEAVIVWQLPVSYGWAPAYPEGWLPAADAAKSLERTLDEVFGSGTAERPGRHRPSRWSKS
jgi:nucleotide-binding universal stress UspA family protein